MGMFKINLNKKSKANFNNDFEEFYKITQVINSSLDLKTTLKTVSESIANITNASYCYIFLKSGEDEVSCAYRYGKKLIFREQYNISTSYHTKKIFKTGKPIVTSNFENYRHYGEEVIDFFKKENICCTLYLPIIKEKKVLGYMWILRKAECSTDIDIKRIMLFVNQMATAISNSQLHHKIDINRSRWKSIFKDSSSGMIITDPSFKILFINKAFETIIDKKSRLLIGINIEEMFVNEKDRLFLEKGLRQNKKTKVFNKELLLEAKNSVIWTSMRVSKSINSADEERYIFSFEDITSKQEFEKDKNEFVSIISHELRNPLTSIKGYLNLIEKKEIGSMNKKQQAFFKKIEDSAERMTELVENLLDVNKINTGKMRLNLSPVSIGKIFKKVSSDLSRALSQKNLKIQLDKDERVYVYGDDIRLYQVFYNLLDNAIKYSFPDGKIKVGYKNEDEHALFYIKDNGVGISPLEQKKLFTKFSRIENIFSVSSGGTGLGLYIVKNLVLAHNGAIWIESKHGKGATFNVKLPLAKQLSLVK